MGSGIRHVVTCALRCLLTFENGTAHQLVSLYGITEVRGQVIHQEVSLNHSF